MHLKMSENIALPESLLYFVGDSAAAFIETLKEPKNWTTIPMINYTPLHQLRDQSVVRFRGMIQDMQDPEIYLERYEVATPTTTRLQDGKYRDCLDLKEGEKINYEAAANIQGERRTLFVVSLPGINEWTLNYEKKCNQLNLPEPETAQHTRPVGIKRNATSVNEAAQMDVDSEAMSSVSDANKRQRVQSKEVDTTSSSNMLGAAYLLNSPIPDRPSKACMIKIYHDFDSYTLNSLVDVVGFLSVDPALAISGTDVDAMMGDFESHSELQAQNPPPSLIPRLHAIAVHRLDHANPLLDAHITTSTSNCGEVLNVVQAQKDLRMLLMLCLFNDDLAADYLISHLISNVYNRSEMQSIGKFTLNICNLPKQDLPASYTTQLYEILELLLPASHYIPMTLELMNTAAFTPKKDYQTNKLVSGLLQLAPHTHLVLDETKMQQGKLEANGVLGIQNLAYLIKQQQIKCNFQYYDIDYNVDVPVLVLSEGRSMLPNDFAVPLQTDTDSVQQITETLKAAHHYLQQPGRLEQFRRFLTQAKTTAFNMNHEDSTMIQTDFVQMRKRNEINGADDLHALLVLSRLLAIAHGKQLLDKESWELAKAMEMRRRQRVQQLPTSNRN